MKQYHPLTKKRAATRTEPIQSGNPSSNGASLTPPPLQLTAEAPIQRFAGAGFSAFTDIFSSMGQAAWDSLSTLGSSLFDAPPKEAPGHSEKPTIPSRVPSQTVQTEVGSFELPLDHPEVQQLQLELQNLRDFEKTVPESQNEEVGTERDELVARIGRLRDLLKALSFEALSSEQVQEVKAWVNRELNALSPYYSQGRSVDFLELATRTRICNLTCTAMALEALGKSNSDYSGDMEVLRTIRNYTGTGKDFNYKKSFDKAKHTTGAAITDLRMPDFLQLAIVAWRMGKGMKLLAAVKQAWDDILVVERFAQVAEQFGVSTSIESSLQAGKTRQEKYEQTFGPALDAGKQIVLLTPGHFVRLQAITEDGLIVDDPGQYSKKNLLKPWNDTKGYFKKALIMEG